jgi:hypothetical protein
MEWIPGNPNDRSIKGFCIRHGTARGPMSKSRYHKLKKLQRGPKETIVGSVISILPADEAAWEDRWRAPTGAAAKLAAKEAELRKARARAAVASPRHISKQRKAGAR